MALSLHTYTTRRERERRRNTALKQSKKILCNCQEKEFLFPSHIFQLFAEKKENAADKKVGKCKKTTLRISVGKKEVCVERNEKKREGGEGFVMISCPIFFSFFKISSLSQSKRAWFSSLFTLSAMRDRSSLWFQSNFSFACSNFSFSSSFTFTGIFPRGIFVRAIRRSKTISSLSCNIDRKQMRGREKKKERKGLKGLRNLISILMNCFHRRVHLLHKLFDFWKERIKKWDVLPFPSLQNWKLFFCSKFAIHNEKERKKRQVLPQIERERKRTSREFLSFWIAFFSDLPSHLYKKIWEPRKFDFVFLSFFLLLNFAVFPIKERKEKGKMALISLKLQK